MKYDLECSSTDGRRGIQSSNCWNPNIWDEVQVSWQSLPAGNRRADEVEHAPALSQTVGIQVDSAHYRSTWNTSLTGGESAEPALTMSSCNLKPHLEAIKRRILLSLRSRVFQLFVLSHTKQFGVSCSVSHTNH